MTLRPIDRLLAALLVLVLALAAAGALTGLLAIIEDLEYSGEFLDGLGVLIGLVVLALVGIPSALASLALRALVQGRASAGKLSVAAGALGMLAAIPFGMFYHPLFAVLVVPLLAAVVAVERGNPGS